MMVLSYTYLKAFLVSTATYLDSKGYVHFTIGLGLIIKSFRLELDVILGRLIVLAWLK